MVSAFQALTILKNMAKSEMFVEAQQPKLFKKQA
jgi:hypothetical protein